MNVTNDEFRRLLSRIYRFLDCITPGVELWFWFYSSIYAAIAFCVVGSVIDLASGNWPLWWLPSLVLAFLPHIALVINAPILWLRTRMPAKQKRLEAMRRDIERLERELEIT